MFLDDDDDEEPINVALFDYRGGRGRGDGALDFTTTVVSSESDVAGNNCLFVVPARVVEILEVSMVQFVSWEVPKARHTLAYRSLQKIPGSTPFDSPQLTPR